MPGTRFCQGCRTEYGAKGGSRVRLVLRDNNPVNVTPANLARLCTRCHPDPSYMRPPRKRKPAEVTRDLF